MVGHRIPYIRLRDGKIIGWAVCTKAPALPDDPAGIWTWVAA